MRPNIRTYTAYSLSCAVVWGVILVAVASTASMDTRDTFHAVFGGWVVGWLSATIARSVYPPPKSRQAPSAVA